MVQRGLQVGPEVSILALCPGLGHERRCNLALIHVSTALIQTTSTHHQGKTRLLHRRWVRALRYGLEVVMLEHVRGPNIEVDGIEHELENLANRRVSDAAGVGLDTHNFTKVAADVVAELTQHFVDGVLDVFRRRVCRYLEVVGLARVVTL